MLHDTLPLRLAALFLLLLPAAESAAAPPMQGWKKHVVFSGQACATAIAADFTGDGKVDIIGNAGGKTRLFIAPDWKEVVISAEPQHFIHSAVLDVDQDGDLDFIGARYSPGRIVWLEQPAEATTKPWTTHLIDDEINGVHGLLSGDVNADGRPDLLANSAQPTGPFANSLVWYEALPKGAAPRLQRHVLAVGDAPGLSHYLGLGDIDGDGRVDAASAAKGGPTDASKQGDWFAWWQAPQDPTQRWSKHLLADKQPGATSIVPADVNHDGRTDFIASRGHGRGVIWFENPTWRMHVIHPTLHGPHCLIVADIDADGDLDAATCAKDDRLAVWFENDGHGVFRTHVVGRDQAAYDIRAVDLNADGRLDLLIAGQQSNNIVWYENPL